jgi:hypothetical protein
MKPIWKLRYGISHRAAVSRTKSSTVYFPPITQNWRGNPLVSHEVVVNLIGATTTTTGLTGKSKLDTNRYPEVPWI